LVIRELNNGYMYVVAENGGEAAEIASKVDSEQVLDYP
jgi:hypothetical protein